MSGTLILVVGPSGSGKDTLIGGAARTLAGDGDFVFPRRIVTRPVEAGGEPHIAQTPEDFEAAEKAGAFALSWRAHSLAYGIPGAIRGDLRAGRHVVVNVSRGVLDTARARFDRVRIVAVTVAPEELARRLAARGREDADDIARRLERAGAFTLSGEDVHTFANQGEREASIAAFTGLLRAIAAD